jgi:hypothetical protein
MSECDAQIFNNITRERWAGMQSKAGQLGVELSGMQTLVIQCLEHPFFAPCALVNAKLKELVDAN